MYPSQKKTNAEEIETYIEEMDLFWSHIVGKFPYFRKFTEVWVPSVNILETDDDVIVIIELPGMEEKDFNVNIHGDLLTIQGEKTTDNEMLKRNCFYKEIYLGSFQRSCVLLVNVEGDKAVSHFNNGILTLTIPKVKIEGPREIEIEIR